MNFLLCKFVSTDGSRFTCIIQLGIFQLGGTNFQVGAKKGSNFQDRGEVQIAGIHSGMIWFLTNFLCGMLLE